MEKVKQSGIPTKRERIGISIVIQVLNEEKTIKPLLSALKGTKAEIIIVDGGSTDNTLKLCKGVKIIRGNYNRSQARNIGVAKAKGKIIVFTDAGCIPEEDWLTNITSPLTLLLSKEKGTRRGGEVCDVVAGYYRGLPQNTFEKCLVPYVLVMPDKLDEDFLPSTRSMAIKKDLFLKTGGFNEALDTSEDFEFANRLKNRGVKFGLAKNAVVGWYPRKNLKQAAWMFFKFAVTDIYAGILRPKVKLLAIRYYLFFFLVFLYWPFVICLFVYLIWAIVKNYKYVRDWRAIFWLPVLQLTADICVLLGTMAGFLSKGSLGQSP